MLPGPLGRSNGALTGRRHLQDMGISANFRHAYMKIKKTQPIRGAWEDKCRCQPRLHQREIIAKARAGARNVFFGESTERKLSEGASSMASSRGERSGYNPDFDLLHVITIQFSAHNLLDNYSAYPDYTHQYKTRRSCAPSSLHTWRSHRRSPTCCAVQRLVCGCKWRKWYPLLLPCISNSNANSTQRDLQSCPGAGSS